MSVCICITQVANQVKAESGRLCFVKNNQRKLRTELYRGVRDAVFDDPNVTGADIGRNKILPATFLGSPRYLMLSRASVLLQ